MELKMVNMKNVAAGNCKLTDQVFSTPLNQGLIHQVVTAYLSTGRQGTQSQKTRSEVRGGGAKPWRQKGTGRARAGTRSSPIWRSGGVTFAAKPRNYAQKVNKKAYRVALKSIFSELIRSSRLVLVDQFEVSKPKTKELKQILDGMKLSDVLVVSHEVSENLYLSSRNLPYVDVRDVEHIDPVSLIAYEKVLVTADAIKAIEEMLA